MIIRAVCYYREEHIMEMDLLIKRMAIGISILLFILGGIAYKTRMSKEKSTQCLIESVKK